MWCFAAPTSNVFSAAGREPPDMLQWAFRHGVMWLAVAIIASAALDTLDTMYDPEGRASVQAGQPLAAAPKKPSADSDSGSRSTTIRSGSDGHFIATADVDGADIQFLVDTGATGVVLTPEDAERVGITVLDGDFTLNFHTANGVVRAAPVTLRRVRIGSLVVHDVDAAVNEVSMGVSLLGVSFLSRLDGYQVRGDQLVLYW
jgi:aspartyl protease family protein